MLIDTNVKEAKPGKKTRKLTDGGGLYLQIEPAGGKLWRYQYRFEGKQKTLALGKYPDVSLRQARTRHKEARALLSEGIDPSAARQAEKAAVREITTNTFEVIAREWLERWKDDKAIDSVKRALSALERDILPFIGNRPISGIKTPEIISTLRRVEDRGCVSLARKTKDVLTQVFRYAIQTGHCEYNPCDNLRGALKPVQVKHFAAFIEPEKVSELLRSIDGYQGGLIVRAALRLAPLVFVRPGELRAARWKDIDLDAGEWKFTVSKTKTEHLVPLSRQAVEVLRDIYQYTGGGEYVFPGIRSKRPISDMTINRALQSMGYDTKTEMTGHGFRAMARTMLSERLKIPENAIEHQLAHKVPDNLRGAYNRTRFLDDRRRMMQAWADYLDDLKTADFRKVVPFERAAG